VSREFAIKTWIARKLLFGRLARAVTTDVIFQSSKSNIIVHRWPMRNYYFQKSNCLDVFLKSASQEFFWKCDLSLPNICFRLSILPNGHRESQKLCYFKWIPRTNETTGGLFCPLIQLVNKLGLRRKLLFGPGSTWTSIAQSWYCTTHAPRRWSFLDRIHPVRTVLGGGLLY
jgi:hypothetical protein